MDALLVNLRNEIQKNVDERRAGARRYTEMAHRLQREQDQNERERQAAVRLRTYRREHPLPQVALVA